MTGKTQVSAKSKIRNATRTEYDGIKFRSKLEAYTYKRLKEENFNNFRYEEITYDIIEKFEYMGEKVRAVKMTPDFIDPDNKILIEVKGYANDVYPLKKKLLKRYMKINNLDFTMFEVKNQKQVEEVIKQLKTK